MKRVLFIAEMNGIAKNLNEEMLPHFQVQLCAADKEYTEKLIHIFEPDIVLIFLNQLNHADVRHLKTLLDLLTKSIVSPKVSKTHYWVQ